MEMKIKRGILTSAFGAAGATAAACAACCLSFPLLGPLSAWLGLAGFGAVATGWYLAGAGVFAFGLLAYLLVRRRRCSPEHKNTCACSTSCKT
jgi:hypothetical protein